MRLDLQRHKLLKLLAVPRIKFESNKLEENEHLGISFDELIKKMNCDIYKLNVIASELYDNKEIKHHNAYNIYGIYCEKEGLTSFASNKYKIRYWKDFWNNILTISQIIVPILALIVALVAVSKTRQPQEHTEEILLLRKELNMQREILNFQTNKISNLENMILVDSLFVE